MQAFELTDLMKRHVMQEELYLEFLRVPDLSMGLYVLLAGSVDPQEPHDEDEVYYVASGKATIEVDGEDRPVSIGSIVYVAAGVPHRFHTIEEDLVILVFFAPAESQ